MTRQYQIPKHLFVAAFEQVKKNSGAAGCDRQSVEEFAKNWKDNLYKLWNRMSSGSYFPLPVKSVKILKRSGGMRELGVPSVQDRVAQTVVKMLIEPHLESVFDPDSYGYRPARSALDAVALVRRRCWEFDWVVEFDIKGLFDNIDHALLMRAVRKHCSTPWILLYIERWLKVPMLEADGSVRERQRGTPQGGVISPVLANLFLHYVFDAWMRRKFSGMRFCRYADDAVVHCRDARAAAKVRQAIEARLQQCGLEIHHGKTHIVYCQDKNRKNRYPNRAFTFLGYTFRSRIVRAKAGNLFRGFTPAVSRDALKDMRQEVRRWQLWRRCGSTFSMISKSIEPVIRGWYQYYSAFSASEMCTIWRHIDLALKRWLRYKYRNLRDSSKKQARELGRLARTHRQALSHWRHGHLPASMMGAG